MVLHALLGGSQLVHERDLQPAIRSTPPRACSLMHFTICSAAKVACEVRCALIY